MTRFLAGVHGVSRLLHAMAGACLVFLMLLTIGDVILRACHRPIPGTYELVGFAGALAIGLSLPLTSWGRGHVQVDSIIARLPPAGQKGIRVVTRLLATALFVLVAWNLVRFGLDLRESGEVSPTLEIRYYPVVLGVAIAAWVQSLVLACDLIRILRGDHE